MEGGAKTKKESLFDLAQDANNDEDADDSETGESEGSDLSNEEILDYQKRIKTALDFLKYDPLKPRPTEYLTSDGLETYSPKFKKSLKISQTCPTVVFIWSIVISEPLKASDS